MKNITNILLGIIAVLIIGVFFVKKEDVRTGIAVQGENFWITETATSSIVTIGSTQKTIVATSTSRRWLNISSRDCAGFFVSLANDKVAVASNSIYVASSTSFTISPTQNAYQGAIHAFAPASCTLLTVGE